MLDSQNDSAQSQTQPQTKTMTNTTAKLKNNAGRCDTTRHLANSSNGGEYNASSQNQKQCPSLACSSRKKPVNSSPVGQQCSVRGSTSTESVGTEWCSRTQTQPILKNLKQDGGVNKSHNSEVEIYVNKKPQNNTCNIAEAKQHFANNLPIKQSFTKSDQFYLSNNCVSNTKTTLNLPVTSYVNQQQPEQYPVKQSYCSSRSDNDNNSVVEYSSHPQVCVLVHKTLFTL